MNKENDACNYNHMNLRMVSEMIIICNYKNNIELVEMDTTS